MNTALKGQQEFMWGILGSFVFPCTHKGTKRRQWSVCAELQMGHYGWDWRAEGALGVTVEREAGQRHNAARLPRHGV